MKKILFLLLLTFFSKAGLAQNNPESNRTQGTMSQLDSFANKHRPPDTISLYDAQRLNILDVEVRGSDIQYVSLRLRSRAPHAYCVIIWSGTYFVCNGSAQNMVSRKARAVTLPPGSSFELAIEAACANRPKDIPGRSDQFEVAESPQQQALTQLMPLLEREKARFTTVQAAVWIVTDDADYADLGVLSDGYGRAIGCDDAVYAMWYCDKAGIDIALSKIWRDRNHLQNCVSRPELRQWLFERSSK